MAFSNKSNKKTNLVLYSHLSRTNSWLRQSPQQFQWIDGHWKNLFFLKWNKIRRCQKLKEPNRLIHQRPTDRPTKTYRLSIWTVLKIKKISKNIHKTLFHCSGINSQDALYTDATNWQKIPDQINIELSKHRWRGCVKSVSDDWN